MSDPEEKEELPLVADDLKDDDEDVEVEEAEEKPEPKPAPVKEEDPEALASYQSRAEKAKERAAKPPGEVSDYDRGAWISRMFQEYGDDIRNPASEFSRIQAMKLEAMIRKGETGPDLDYRAAQEAASDPRITRTRSEDASRERRVKASAQFERPSGRSDGDRRREAEQPDLTRGEMEHARSRAGIKSKAALQAVAEGLAAARRMP